MANIIPKRTEPKLNLFFDLDGTLKDHSKIEKSLYRLLIPSSMNQEGSGYRKILTTASNIYAPISRVRMFEDVARIPAETREFATNRLYTLNSPKAIKYFLQKTDLKNSFTDEITLDSKNPGELTKMLIDINGRGKNSLAVLIGDAIVDIENNYKGNSISVALEGPLERKQGKLESISDIYIPEIERLKPELVRYKIYNRINKEMEEIGFSKKVKVRKEIINLRDYYESVLAKDLD